MRGPRTRGLTLLRTAALVAALFGLTAREASAADLCVSTPAELQAALDTAETNAQDDVVRIVSGHYAGSFLYSCPYPEAYSISVLGGYDPGCLARTENHSLTVLDGSGSGHPLSVQTGGYPLADLTVDNLTVTGGTAAGLFAVGGNVDVSNCAILDNHGLDPGVATAAVGGAFLKGTLSLRVSGCVVSSNRSYGALAYYDGANGGGGIYVPESGAVEIRGCTFTGNQTLAGVGGALLVNYAASVLLEGNVFDANTGQDIAGACLDHCSNIAVRDNVFANHASASSGVGLETYFSVDGDILLEGNVFTANAHGGARLASPVKGGAVRVLGNTFRGNTTSGFGGGLFLVGAPLGGAYSSVTVANNVFDGNSAGRGGALWVNAVEPIVVTNNTFTGNGASQRGGGAYVEAGYSTSRIDVWNNIFHQNAAPVASDADLVNELILFGAPYDVPLVVSHNALDPAGVLVGQAGYALPPTNIGPLDPLFSDAAAGDHRLLADSPCIDAGSVTAPGLPATDADGLPRVRGASVDLGAYEAPSVNRSPYFDPAPVDRSVVEGVALSFIVAGRDPDAGDATTLSLVSGPWGAEFDAATGTFSWRPGYAQAGRHRVTFRVTDTGVPPRWTDASIVITVSDPTRPIFWDAFEDGSVAGDPHWTVVSGKWSAGAGAYVSDARSDGLSRVLKLDPVAAPVAAGAVDAKVTLTPGAAVQPNGWVLFAFRDAARYRYVRLTPGKIAIGQVGAFAGVAPGVKKAAAAGIDVGRQVSLRIEIRPGGVVRVLSGGVPVASHRFPAAAAGGIALRAARARTLFDSVRVWDEAVLVR